MYYLQSRYYDPAIGRFVNADGMISTRNNMLGVNLFAYCYNNPINLVDNNGQFGLEAFSAAVIGMAALGICAIVAVGSLGALLIQSITTPSISLSKKKPVAKDEAEETLPRQGLVTGDSDAPPVDAGKQGKHVPGHNNYDDSKSSWPEGKTGVQQTQEAWKNGSPDPKKPDGSVRIGVASDGTEVRVHMDKKGAIHGYPYKMVNMLVGVIINEIISTDTREFLEVVWDK